MTGRLRQLRALFDLFGRGLNQGADFFGRRCAALRQIAHFCRHHRKAASLLTRMRSFHGGIQCQDIGPECDALDSTNIAVDGLGALANFLHGGHHLGHDRPTLHGRAAGTAR